MFKYKKQISTKNLDKEFEFFSEKIMELKLPDGFRQFILYAISELFANIREHSVASKIGILLTISKTNFSLEITDNGIGLRKSYIQKGIYPKDDFSAIEFALAGLSTKESKQRGFGLYSIKKLIKVLNGFMSIKSGSSLVKILKNKIETANIKEKSGVGIFLKTPIKNIEFYKYIE